jgi:SAM-dependent methyltransferase
MSHTTEFSGDVPGFYDRGMGPVMFEPYARDLAARLPAGEELRVLELACGTGIVTRHVRAALPESATLVATDLNEAMVDYARAAVPGPGIEWRAADAQALPFADGSFDAVLCQFGLMFLPDKALGLREARRVLASGGTLLANVWRPLEENGAALLVHQLLERTFPDDPPRFFETPYGYSDRARLRDDLEAGGWERFRFEDVRLAGESTTARALAEGLLLGSPVSFQLRDRGADIEALVATFSAQLEALGGAQPCRVPLSATVIEAHR